DPAINARVIAAASVLARRAPAGVRDVVPAFRTVTVYFDPATVDAAAITNVVSDCLREHTTTTADELRIVRVPVCYGGGFGPDLASGASFGGLDEAAVIARHSAPVYRVFMLGFMPGFAYMASVAAEIAAPRLATPRLQVPAGSVGIAGVQTGIYPSESPGG